MQILQSRCGPCRQFTPDLVNFYDKMNARRGKKDEFEIIWVSRCRDVDSFGQYFTHMKWLALPPQEAMGQRGQYLGEKYKVKSIPTLVLLDEIGNVITTDARNKIPMDKAGKSLKVQSIDHFIASLKTHNTSLSRDWISVEKSHECIGINFGTEKF
jgi:nucleoredoxin